MKPMDYWPGRQPTEEPRDNNWFAIMSAAIVIIMATIALTGCVTNHPGTGVALPRAPAYYQACFKKLTDIPTSSLTRDVVVKLVADLRKSELAKSRCGKDLLAWYDNVVSAYNK